MHIALYSPAWPLGRIPSGVVTYVHFLRAALIAQGHRVSVFADSIDPECGDGDVYPITTSISRRIGGWLRRLLRRPRDETFSWGEAIAAAMASVHKRDPLDVVEMEESFGWCEAVQRDLGVPVVAKLHGPAFLTAIGVEAESPLARGRVQHEGRALLRVAAVTAPSRFTLEATVKRYNLPAGILEHVPNPISMADEAPQWSLDSCDRRTVLFVGRFDWVKGGDLIVEAFARVLDSYPDARLLFVGPDDGLTDDDGRRRQLVEYANATLGIARMASIACLGKLESNQICELRTRALMTVVASRFETQGYTALEAMAQGCPTIAADAGGLSELIEHGVTGWLFSPGDADSLFLSIVRLLGDAALCERLGKQARVAVREAHSPSTLAVQTTRVYERAVAVFLAGRQV